MDNVRRRIIIILHSEDKSGKADLLENLLKFFFGDHIEVNRHWLDKDLRENVTYFHVYETDDDVFKLIERFGDKAPIIPFLWMPKDRVPANTLYIKGPIYAYWAADWRIPVRTRLKTMLGTLMYTLRIHHNDDDDDVSIVEDKINDYLRLLKK